MSPPVAALAGAVTATVTTADTARDAEGEVGRGLHRRAVIARERLTGRS